MTTCDVHFPDKVANRERAAFRLVEMLTPAAALAYPCTESMCGADVGEPCQNEFRGEVRPVHDMRLHKARAELHALLVQLGIGT